MAKNREPEKPVESDTESEEEDDDASSEESGSQESDSEPEQTQVTKKPSSSTPAATTTKKPQPPSASKPEASSSSEEESGSESDSDTDGPDPNVKPIASKPMEAPQKSNGGARKPRSKPTASDPATPAKPSAAKRPAEEKETEAKDAKKSKKKPEAETSEKKSNDDSKKSLFQRLWSEDDEIAILEGMIEYEAKKKSDPVADLNAFHEFIKKNLHVDVTRVQLQDKIRRLKKKYANNKSKEKEGKERTFSKPHEQKAYELSKTIWGNESGKDNGGEKVVGSTKANGTLVRKTPIKRANVADDEDVKDVKMVEAVGVNSESIVPANRVISYGVSMEERIMRIGDELFEDGNEHEGTKEWKRLKMEKMEAHLNDLEIQTAQTRLVLDKLKSAGQ